MDGNQITPSGAVSTLIELLRGRARTHPGRLACTFLVDGDGQCEGLSYGELDLRARAIAARLQRSAAAGERALLLYPPGLDFIAAFLGCLYSGVVAVPAAPANSRRGGRLRSIVADARPRLALAPAGSSAKDTADLAGVRWLSCESGGERRLAESWTPPAVGFDSPAFLQYTSGSTAEPKGVVVSHGNLLANQEMIQEGFGTSERSIVVGWLPVYHDMGLIGNVLHPLFLGGHLVLMSPLAFLQRPVRWLRAISRFRATVSGGPDFAYSLCARRIRPEDRRDLDLRSWQVAFNGAEPVRPATLERFAEAFGPCGFRRRAFLPCYGLAEATLMVTGGASDKPPVVRSWEPRELEEGRAVPAEDGRALAACGRPPPGLRLAVVDPRTLTRVPADRVGEIWVAGPTIAHGYWRRERETARTFQARPAAAGDESAYLRTGDLGFMHDGELFVTGRLKDLIILRGRNLYPQDVELTAERAHPALAPGGGAAFPVEVDGEERLVVVHEVGRRGASEAEAAAEAIRREVAEEHEARVHEVVVVRAGSVPKTTSGKIRRQACRQRYLEGGLAVIFSSAPAAEDGGGPRSAGVVDRGTLLSLPSAERRPALEAHLRGEVARIVRVRREAVLADRRLTGLGLDSLAAVELQRILTNDLEITLPLAQLLAGASLDELVTVVLDRLHDPPDESPEVPLPAGGGAAEGERPLSYGQRALWFLARLAPTSAAYNLAAAARVASGLDPAVLERAWRDVLARHPALRSVFRSEGGEPRQRACEASPAAFSFEDASGLGDRRLAERLAELAWRPFDLETGPAARLAVLRRSAEEHLVVLAVHHLVADFWSMAVLTRELGVFYRRRDGGSPAPPPPLRHDYHDWVAWQEAVVAGAEGERLWRYWQRRLDGVPTVLELPSDRRRPTVESFRGGRRTRSPDAGMRDAVRALAENRGATFHGVLLAAFQGLLHRFSGQRRLIVGSPAAGRRPAGVEGLVGYFVNPLPLVADLTGDPTAGQLVERVRDAVFEALDHQDFPLPLLAERLQPERAAGRSPLFQAMFTWQRTPFPASEALAAFALGWPGAELELGGLILESVALEERGAPFDLTLQAAEVGDGIGLSLQFNRDLFDATTAERWLGHFETLLRGMSAEPDRRIAVLPLLSPAERGQMLREWNATRTERGDPRPLHELCAAQVERSPLRIAVVCRAAHLTFAELDRRANGLAHRLRSLGVGPEVRVGVAQERSVELVVSLLGVLKAGAAYVPLDPGDPPGRLDGIAADAAVPVVLTVARFRPLFAGGSAEVLCLDEAPPSGSPEDPAVRVLPDHLVYVIYTSGSTGRPKGAMNRHRSLCNRLLWMQETYGLGPGDRVLQKTPLSFDVSAWELFWPLLTGACLVLERPGGHQDPARLKRSILEQRITTVHFVPSMLRAFLDQPALGGCRSLKRVIASGEALPAELAGRFRERLDAELHNLYGPTEAAIDVTFEPCTGSAAGISVPIGRPIANTRLYVLDRRFEPVPVGVPGELFLEGVGLARGYHGRPALTAERFVPHGIDRLYRTGDLVRWLADGRVEFLGRLDFQVKIRGVRVELEEVEAVLTGHPAVREAAVVDREDGALDRRLVAFAVPASEPAVPADELRRYLAARLPGAMVPARVVALESLPRTASGKLDRGELRRRPLPAPSTPAAPPSRTPVEELLAGAWCDLLGVAEAGAEDSFFDLGGHSLLATRLVSRIRRIFGVELPLGTVFEAPTLRGLAGRIAAAAGTEGAELPPIERGGEDPVASFSQERLWFLDRFEPGNTAFNMLAPLRLRGELDVPALAAAAAGVVRRHEVLRTTFEERDGRPRPRIASPPAVELPVIDLEALSEEVRRSELARRLEDAAAKPFDLARGPLLRLALLRLAAREHVLTLDVHHVVSDGWSMGLLIREIADLYGGRELPELPIRYSDYAAWQRRWLSGPAVEEQLTYWEELLGGGPPVSELPADRPRRGRQTFTGTRTAATLDGELAAGLERLGRRAGATLFMTLLAAFKVLLSRHSGQLDVVVGTPVAGRTRAETEELAGIFLNTLALRTDLTGRPTFRELLERVRRTALGAYGHQDVPFEKVLERLAPERDLSRTPLFQVFFNMLPPLPEGTIELPGLTWELMQAPLAPSKFDLTLYVAERPEGIALELVSNADLFDADRMTELLGQYRHLLEQVAADPERRIDSLRLLTPGAGAVLPDPGESLDAGWPGPVHELFAAAAARRPDHPAVVDGRLTWSYGELLGRVEELASRLARGGVAAGDVVAVYAHRGAPLVEALLAVLRAGAAFVILDPAYPAIRLAAVARAVRPRGWLAIAAAGRPAELLEEAVAETCVWRHELSSEPTSVPASGGFRGRCPEPEDVAYLGLTSGSTGTPRAVIGRHGSLSHFIPWHLESFGLRESDRFSLLSGLSHDPLHRDVFVPLALGATVVVPEPETIEEPGALARWMERQRITVAYLTPALGQVLTAARGVTLPDLRRTFFVGDVLTRRDVGRLRRLAPATDCVNFYGTTETQQALSWYRAPRNGLRQTLPLGRGIRDVQLLVRGRDGAPAGLGELGEICFRSPHLAIGYFGDPRSTAERFVPHRSGERLYRTGDLGRYLAGGDVAFAGRADRQVQIRGFRVEPGEIEAELGRHPGVAEAVVVPHRDGAPARLVAYLLAARGARRPVSPELRDFLSRRLPRHMVPAHYVALEAFPLSPNGKVDRAALARREPPDITGDRTTAAPRGPVEEALTAIWSEVLARPGLGVHDDFFDLGGHSLLATQLVSRIRDAFDVDLPVRALFESPTVAELAEVVARDSAAAVAAPPIEPLERPLPGMTGPLSYAQERQWFLEQMEAGTAAYNLSSAVPVRRSLDPAVLRRCFHRVAARHEILRASFRAVEGRPLLVLAPDLDLPLPVVGLAGLGPAASRREARRLADREARRPFDLSRPPLVRITLLKLGEAEDRLLLSIHHILSDDWSMGLLMEEVSELYEALTAGREPLLPELPIQYVDYAAWQRRWLTGEVLEKLLGYWRRRLGAGSPVLELPTDRPRPAVRSSAGDRHPLRLDGELTRGLRELARRSRGTLFMTLLAVMKALLHRLTGQTDLTVGTYVAHRNRSGIERLVGFFVNNLVLRTDAGRDPRFADFLERVRQGTLADYDHQDLPFERLLEDLAPERSLSHTPLFQVMLVLQNAPTGIFGHVPDEDASATAPAHGAGRARFDLTLWLWERSDAVSGQLEYDTDLFDRTTVRRLWGHFRALLAGAVEDPRRALSRLPLVPAAQRFQLLVEMNDNRVARRDERPVHRLFEARARQAPEATAIVAGDRVVSYRGLDRRAEGLARSLRRRGVGPEVTVGVAAERVEGVVVALLATWKAGGVFLPLDPSHPEERLDFMLRDAGARVLLCDSADLLNDPPVEILRLGASEEGPVTAARGAEAGPDHLAYVIYTSGTTGRPKGVATSHRAIVPLLLWSLETFDLGPHTRVLQNLSYCFDFGLFELATTVLCGGVLVCAEPREHGDFARYAELVVAERIDTVHSTPSFFRELLAQGRSFPSLRTVHLGGELLSRALVRQIEAATAEGCRAYNGYGPTEAAVNSAIYRLAGRPLDRGLAGAAVPIGRATANNRILLLDRHGRPVPLGVAGELVIGGDRLARGYLGGPESGAAGRTARRFVPDPFAAGPGGRLYRTGDLARARADGNVDFLGRIDHQVKVRGFRIELGEVESVLRQHPAVRAAAVLSRDQGTGGARLVAYHAGDGATAGELRRFLGEKLPDYMVPSAFVELAGLPLTPNGKVDRAALPAPDWGGSSAETYVAPRTPVEEMVAGIWSELLGVERVGTADSFFELGGHSLLATRITARLRSTFDVELPLRAFFEAPTVAEQAARIERRRGDDVPPIERMPRDVDLPLSYPQERIWFLAQLDPTSTAYHVPRAYRARGRFRVPVWRRAYEELLRRHEILRTSFPAKNGQPRQQIHPPAPFSLPVADLAGLAEPVREAELRRLVLADGRRLFDLANGPMLRAMVLRLGADEHVIVQTEHHLVHDGWAEGVLIGDLLAIAGAIADGRSPRGPTSGLRDLPIQYADFASWQRRWLVGEVLERQLAYWTRQLAGAPAVLELPWDRPRPAVKRSCGAERSVPLAPRLADQARDLGRRLGVTLFMTLLAAFKTLLHRWSGQDDLVIGTGVANRHRHETEGLLGMIINTLPLRTELRRSGGEPSVRRLVSQVREVCLGAYAHQDVPFGKLVEVLKPERSLSHTPIFQVMFAFHDAPVPEPDEESGLVFTPVTAHNRSAKFDLNLIMVPYSERSVGRDHHRRHSAVGGLWEYDGDLFDAATIDRLIRHFQLLLAGMASDPERRLGELPLLTAAERHQLRSEWNDGAVASPATGELCLHQLFTDRARRHPDRPALVFGDHEMTYGELDERSDRLARRLRSLGVAPEARVGLCVERSPVVALGILGVLKAGGAYLPLDPSYPRERLAFMLADSGAAVVLTQRSLAGRLPAEGRRVVILDGPPDGEAPAVPGPPVSVDQLAYVIYTSGSTGEPKGVEVTHRHVVRLFAATEDRFGFGPDDVWTFFHSAAFDFSVWEIWGAWLHGGRLVIVPYEISRSPEDFHRLLAEERVTVLSQTPSAFRQLVRADGGAGERLALRWVIFGGEALELAALEPWFTRYGDASRGDRAPELVNMYGITETTVHVTVRPLSAAEASAARGSLIGSPLADLEVYLLDRGLGLVPLGSRGEICVGGAGVARGYLERPGLAGERFVPDPFSRRPGQRMYRSGDLARALPAGELVYLGRRDHQVKIRGFRVELGEIEAEIAHQPAVREAVVIRSPGSAQLVACLVVEKATSPSVRELRTALGEKLPEHMIPAVFVRLDSLPLTAHGKVDRAALGRAAPGWTGSGGGTLPEPGGPRGNPLGSGSTFVAPGNTLEQTVAEIWRQVLGVVQVGVHDNFFDLGGHSLLVVQVQSQLRQALAREVPIIELFRYPTVRTLARFLGGEPSTAGRRRRRDTRLRGPQSGSPTAIIGMAGRFPGAADVGGFWSNLCGGQESVTFFNDQELLEAGVDPEHLSDPSYVKAAALLDQAECFDAELFGIHHREAEIMDPQQRIFLECAWAALEDAGYDPDRFPGPIGVYAGCRMGRNWLHLASGPRGIAPGEAIQAQLGNDKDFLPLRVSYKLNLKGPSVSVQTACSTSLVAAHMAIQALAAGECDMALAGGVSVRSLRKEGYLYQPEGIASPDGHCRAFDARARGTVGGSGVALVVLKRLDDAMRDGDAIRAVIRGSAVNNDGSCKIGFTAPSVEGQAAVIADALDVAGIEPRTIGFVETHGTGTRLGDPIEIAALKEVFGSEPGRHCALGALKTNVGHLDAAAGVAGLIKATLVLQHRRIPPSLHFEKPNPEIDLENSPFYVNTELAEWPRPGDTSSEGGPLRAAVSSFGLGGTNAHMVLEEAPAPSRGARPAPATRTWRLLMLSAKSAAALDRVTANLAEHLRSHSQLDLADVAYTLALGRRPLDHRRCLVCRDRDTAAELLERDGEGVHTGPRCAEERPVVFMFPGQGSQYLNMGRGLYESEATFRRHVDRCCEELEPHLGCDLRAVMYPAVPDREAAAHLRETRFAQPALFVVEYALARLWMEWGVEPQGMVGHSIGELVAACLAGVFSLEDALAVVAARGRLVQGLPAGAMLSVPLSPAELEPLLGDKLSLAAVNGPRRCVASGHEEAIAGLERRLAERDVAARRLHTSHAFHSPMVEPILEPFRRQLAELELRPPRRPFLSNVTGRWAGDEVADPDYWVRHLRQAVLFADAVEVLCQEPGRVLLEVGPGRGLSTLVKQRAAAGGPAAVASMRHPRDSGSDAALVLTALGRLWAAGCAVDVRPLFARESRRRIPLPTYPFERRSYRVDPAAPAARPRPAAARRSALADWFYLPSWKRSVPPAFPGTAAGTAGEPEEAREGGWLVFADAGGLAAAVVQRLEAAGHQVSVAHAGDRVARLGDRRYEIRPGRREDCDTLLESLAAAGSPPRRIAHFWGYSRSAPGERSFEQAQEHGFYSLLFLVQALVRRTTEPLALTVVANGLESVEAGDELSPEKATVLGLLRVLPQEIPHLACKSVDVAPPPGGWQEKRLVEQLAAELASEAPDLAVAYRAGRRLVGTYEATPVALSMGRPSGLRQRGVYLITGGLGNVGMALAELLGRHVRARLALVGRGSFPPRERWGEWRAEHGDQDPRSLEIARLQAIEDQGGEVLVVQADVSCRDQMRAALARVVERFGELHGVVHAAADLGVDGVRAIEELRYDDCERQFRPKVRGATVLEEVLRGRELDFCLLFSSLSAVLGGLGFGAYAAANASLDAFAQSRSQTSPVPWVSVNWDSWRFAVQESRKMPVGGQLAETAMDPAEGVEALQRILSLRGVAQIVVSTTDLAARMDTWLHVRSGDGPGPPGAAGERPDLATDYVAPRNETERTLAEIWQRLLGIERVGVEDDFFELGGDSLVGVQLVAQVRRAFQVEVSLRTLFEAPIIARLATEVTGEDGAERQAGRDAFADILSEVEGLSEVELDEELADPVGEEA